MATTIPEFSADSLVDMFYDATFNDPLIQEFYGHSGYANIGFWDASTRRATQACDRLVDEILRPLDKPAGRVLEVGCGHGATTKRLCDVLAPASVTAIGISGDQLAAAKKRAAGARFRNMDAVHLEFSDATFDTVFSVEAAFHFDTRARFFTEALRVLKPRGQLVLSDLLLTRGTPAVPAENYVPSLTHYGRLLRSTGFVQVRVDDVYAETWLSYREHYTRFMTNGLRFLNPRAMRALYTANVGFAWALRGSLIAHARKPG